MNTVKADFVLNVFRKLGIDRAVAYTLLGRAWQAVAGLMTLWLIARFLSSVEQGFYFTFASVLSLQVFVELGFSVVVLQFASHEKAYLQWEENGILSGDMIAKERLSSLIKLTIKWYSVAAIIILFAVLPAGYYYFHNAQVEYPGVSWQSPWSVLIFSFLLFFIVSPFLNILEGCGKVKDIAKVRLKQGIIANLLLWIGFAAGFGLFSISLVYIGKFIVMVAWLGSGWRKTYLRDMVFLKGKSGVKINWRKEIFPFQWKIALSWMSGYFIFPSLVALVCDGMRIISRFFCIRKYMKKVALITNIAGHEGTCLAEFLLSKDWSCA